MSTSIPQRNPTPRLSPYPGCSLPISGSAKQANEATGNALKTLLAIGGAGAATGAGVTAASGLFRKRKIPARSKDPEVELNVPKSASLGYAVEPALNWLKDKGRQTSQIAGAIPEILGALPGQASALASRVAGPVYNPVANAVKAIPGELMKQQEATPWLAPAALGVGGAGLLGGSAAAEAAIHHGMKSRMTGEMGDAAKDFEDAIAIPAQHPHHHGHHKLSCIYDELEKQGVNFDAHPGLKGAVPYAAGGLAALLAAYGGSAGYNFINNRSQEKLLDKAVKNKEYLKSLRGPDPVHVIANSPAAAALV